jgi:hypothetical protein
MKNKITNEQLLDCLTQGQELITTHGMNDLRSTLKNRGYGSQITPLDIEDVMKIAENLVEKNQALWKHSNWLQMTLQGLIDAGEPLTLIVNWDTIDQTLENTTDEEQEEFVKLSREYASEQGWRFDTIRNIQKPAFFLSIDGETILPDQEDETTYHFCRICEQLTA